MKNLLKIIGVVPILGILYLSACIVFRETSVSMATENPVASCTLLGSCILFVVKMITFNR